MSDRDDGAEPGAATPSAAPPTPGPRTIRLALSLAMRHQNAGRLAQAEALYRQILEIDPKQVSALHLLGVVALQSQRYDLAVDLIGKALAIDPDYAEAHYNLGVALQTQGKPADAMASFEKAIALKPDNAAAHFNLGSLLHDRGEFMGAATRFREAIALTPDFAEAHNNLGNAQRELGQRDDALASYREAVALRPDFAEAHYNLANLLAEFRRFDEAVASFESVIALRPDHAEAHHNLGRALKSAGRSEEAIASYRKAIAARPDFAAAHNNLGNALKDLGRLDEAVVSYQKAIAITPDLAVAYNNLGNALRDLRRLDEAVDSYKRAIALKPEYAEVHDSLGNALKDMGRLDDAGASYRKSIDLNPNYATAHFNLGTLLEDTNRPDEAEIHLRKALEIDPDLGSAHVTLATLLRRRGKVEEAIAYLNGLSPGKGSRKSAYRFHFELGKLHDLAKNSDDAFAHFTKGNQLQAENVPTNISAARALNEVTHATEAVTPAFARTWSEVPDEASGTTPIFLVGFPRSGTTLLDQILDSHPVLQVMEEKPALAGARSIVAGMGGEYPTALASLSATDIRILRDQYLHDVDQHIARQDGTILVDKLPLNICQIPLIVRMFPRAPVIVALRHPCDAVLSNFMQAYRLNDAMANFLSLEGAARYYNRVMGFWLRCAELLPVRHHVIRYEDLVVDFEAEVRRLVAFLDLEWDDATMNYAAHARQRERINTPSYNQVIQPIYQRAKYRWLRYEKYFDPVREDLDPYIEAFGYADAAQP